MRNHTLPGSSPSPPSFHEPMLIHPSTYPLHPLTCRLIAQSRFILNLPPSEMSSVPRLVFQVEQAYWYYEDWVREVNPALPSYNLKRFCDIFFKVCPVLSQWDGEHERMFLEFMRYKSRVPVCGAIMINETWDKVRQPSLLLWSRLRPVRSRVSGHSAFSSRAGRVTRGPSQRARSTRTSPNISAPSERYVLVDLTCEQGVQSRLTRLCICTRIQVLEETGCDLTRLLEKDNFLEVTMQDQRITLYIVPGVPEDFPFKTQTRKEIGVSPLASSTEGTLFIDRTSRPRQAIEWFKLSELPMWKKNRGHPPKAISGRYYMMAPFIPFVLASLSPSAAMSSTDCNTLQAAQKIC